MGLLKVTVIFFEIFVLMLPILMKARSIAHGAEVPRVLKRSFITSLLLRGRPSHDVVADRRLYVSQRFDMICGGRCPTVMSVILAALWSLAFFCVFHETFPLPRPLLWLVVHSPILFLAFALQNDWMNGRTVHLWYTVLMFASALIHIRYMQNAPLFWKVSKGMVFARLGVSTMINDFRMHTFASLLHTSLNGSCFYYHQYYYSALTELPTLCIVLVFGGFSISGSWMSAVELVDADETKREMAATSELLRIVCDAVVELDSQGVITNTGTDLAALLLRGTDMSLKGVNFRSLLAQDVDRLTFDSRVGTSEIQVHGATASVVGVRIVDAVGNLLRLQLLHVPFFVAEGRLRHLIGIRESADTLDEFRVDAKCDKTRDRCRRSAVEPHQKTSDAASSVHLASRPSVVGTMVFDASNFEVFFLVLRTGLFFDTSTPRALTCGLQTLLPDCPTNNKFKSSLESYLACFVSAESTNQHPPAPMTDLSIVLQSPRGGDGHHSAETMFANCWITLHRIGGTVFRGKTDSVHAIASCCDVDVGANQENSSSTCRQDDKSQDRKIVAVACLWGGASPSGSFMETFETRSEGSSSGQESGSNSSGCASSYRDAEQASPEATTLRRSRRSRRKHLEREWSRHAQINAATSAALTWFGDVEGARFFDKDDATTTEGSQCVAPMTGVSL